MNENSNSILSDDEERVRQFLVASLAPNDPATASDAEFEELLEGLADESYSEDRLESLRKKVEVQLRDAAQPAFPKPQATLPVDEDSDAAPAPPTSPILGFLGNLAHLGGSFTPTFWTLLVLVSGMVLTLTLVLLAIRGIHVHVDGPEVAQWKNNVGGHGEGPGRKAEGGSEIADFESEISSSSLPAASSPPRTPSPVARLTRVADCRWADRALEPGDHLKSGQSLHLAAGVAELNFEIGVWLVLQGPASLEIQSADSARLDMGKLTAEITTEKARGFQVRTPRATFVDQGTEFGVEVSPGGSSRIHVFKGRVDVAVNAQGGKAPPAPQRLMENVGARLEGDAPTMTLMEDTGESFIRSMDQSERDRHVIAYWRFEDRPLGMLLPDTRKNTRNVRATTDSSFNGNDLFAWSPATQPYFSGDVPATIVPQNAAANRGCLNNTVPFGAGVTTRDVATRSQFSHASPLDIQKVTPAQWTIEASVKPLHLGRGCQTFVGRDGNPHYNVGKGKLERVPPRLAFQVTAEDRFAIRFHDVDNRAHEAVAAELALQENHWYHAAASSDGRVLRLYVDALDGQGYQLQAMTALPADGSTALGKGNDECEWSIGRGKAAGIPAEWFQGWIDEVRVSDVALDPAEFLFVPKE